MDIENELVTLGELIERRKRASVSLSAAERTRILHARAIARANDMSHRRISALLDEGAALVRGTTNA